MRIVSAIHPKRAAHPDYRATFRVFKIERKIYGREDLQFLERVFQKLLLNFTW